MSFLWPEMLWLLLVVPALVALYILLLRRKKKTSLQYASLTMVKEAMGVGHKYHRHIPPALLLLGLILMIVAVARPTAVVVLPSEQRTVILAMDVSGSMRATDVKPSRIAAAQAAARAFIAEQPSSTRIGVVAFAATASVVQPPTLNREDLLAAIDRFQLQRGTATGSGLIISLSTLFPDAGFSVSSALYGQQEDNGGEDSDSGGVPLGRENNPPPKKDFKPVSPGSYTSAAIILLTDGQRTTGPDPLDAARMAADHGVRVFTVGVGTIDGETIGFEGWSMRVSLDEATLRTIASMTKGEYFYAGNAVDLKKIYQSLNSRFVLQTKETEITAFFSAAAAMLTFLAALLSMLWFNRIL
ncbi:MAG TPA: VWA domain-containing protein [Rhodocyclaceae bacterium]|nr:VWA domain-containing protein [Rhodocyclaceae bacterium]